jgi:hypothetical protein
MDALGQFFLPGAAVPFLEDLRRDLALDQQLRKLSALRFAFDRH